MKSIIGVLVFLFFNFVSATQAYEGFTQNREPDVEEIVVFDTKIKIEQDTSLSIIEKISYFTPDQKHGIFRYIPEKYRREGMIVENPVSDISVTDYDGKAIPFETTREGGNVTLKIGNPEYTFSGLQTYIISYKVNNALLRHKDFDELYWDITGEGWSFPILSATATIESPFAKTREVVCFTGPVGGTDRNCETTNTTTISASTQETIYPGWNFTVAVKLDKNNSLIFPSTAERWFDIIKNNGPLGLLFLPGVIMFAYWYKKGRDYRFVSPNVFDLDDSKPKGLRPLFESVDIPFVYEPLKDLTPGEAGAILDERVDNQDVVAEIIDLARKKYLKIERVDREGFLKFGHDYLFTKLKATDKLRGHQKYLMDSIFTSKEEVKLSELKGTFYTHMSKVKEMIYDTLTERKLFTSKPSVALGKAIGLVVFVDIAVFYLAMPAIVFVAEPWPVLVLFISFIVSLIFALKMTQKTAVGTNLSLQAKGLRDTIRLGKWREEIKEKHLFIEEILPFAISLGVIAKLTKDMAALHLTPPAYFGGGFGTDTRGWSGFMNDFSKSAQSGLSYNPSSSTSGRSGFSGGSSGGGGGGGGGGSW